MFHPVIYAWGVQFGLQPYHGLEDPKDPYDLRNS